MEKRYRQFNVMMYVVMAVIFSAFVVFGVQSGHPWSLTCYQCRACNINCPLGYDVASYVAAAATDNPDLYMRANKLQLTLEEAYETDKNMIVEVAKKQMTAKDAVDAGVSPDSIVLVRKLRAKDAAKFDPLEGNCESHVVGNQTKALCPINLPITNIIRDLKDNGRFG